ncbi:MAG: electron transfer flavoprotein subunit alpha/FixB family protein [Chloroflexi bacterium]|nr:electron transfer flavoprotein subunit alpha/FixB family protein [Chloroflexota bacterium]
MSSSNEIWALAEVEGSEPKKISLELISKAAQLAGELGGAATAVVLSPGGGAAAGKLEKYGASAVLVAEDERLGAYLTTPQTDVLATLVKERAPKAILFGGTNTGRDIASRLAARLRVGVVADATEIEVKDGKLVLARPIFGGSLIASKTFGEAEPWIIVVRQKAFPAVEKPVTARVEEIQANIQGTALAKIVDAVVEKGAVANLEEADVIVAGGRGVGGPDNFSLLEELAAVLGGVVGASRAPVDSGWISYPHQVGQTGKTVKPKLYIACGISGAIQHKVGMQTSDCIIAINKDPDAPIFSFADLGIVGDLCRILPQLTAEVKKRR